MGSILGFGVDGAGHAASRDIDGGRRAHSLAAIVAARPCSAVAAAPQARTRRDRRRADLHARTSRPSCYKNCVSCHRPGEIAPMSLLTFQEARPYASIDSHEGAERHDAAVARRSARRHFLERSPADDGREGHDCRWVDGGSPQGDPKDLPPAPTFADGWSIGTPDVVLTMPKDVRGAGVRRRSTTRTSTSRPISPKTSGCRRSSCARARRASCITSSCSRVRPDARAERDPFRRRPLPNGGNLGATLPERPAAAAAAGAPQAGRAEPGAAHAGSRRRSSPRSRPAPTTMVFQPGTALQIKAGTTVIFQVHYTANGKPSRRISRASASSSRRNRRAGDHEQPVHEPAARFRRRGRPTSASTRRSSSRATRTSGRSSRTRTCAARAGSIAGVSGRPFGSRAVGAEVRLQLADVLSLSRSRSRRRRARGSRRSRTTTIRPRTRRTPIRRPSRPLGRADVGGDAVHRHHLHRRTAPQPAVSGRRGQQPCDSGQCPA